MDGIDTWQTDELTAVTTNALDLNSVRGEDRALNDKDNLLVPVRGSWSTGLLYERHRVLSSVHMQLSTKNVLEKLLERRGKQAGEQTPR